MGKDLIQINKKYINSKYYGFSIFIILLLIHLPWINFDGLVAVDTSGYVDVSKHFYNSDYIHFRPIIYPLLIYISGLFGQGVFGILIYVQLLFYCLSAVLLFSILIRENLFKNTLLAALIVIISFAAPQAMFANHWVLPEMLPLPFLLLLYIYLGKAMSIFNSLIIAILIIIPILIKPLWLLLLVFPLIVFIYSDKNLRSFIYKCVLPSILVVGLYSINQALSVQEGKSSVAASTGDAIINISLLRMGLVEGAEETDLYHYIERENLLKEVKRSEWSNEKEAFKHFTMLKNTIPWDLKEDPQYWKSVLKNPKALSFYLITKLSRLPIFFSTSAANLNVNFLPGFFNSIYQRIYSNIHSKHMVGIFFILFGLIISLFNFKKFTFLKYVFFLILGTSLALCLLTYQDQNFLRMRAVIEPLILVTVLYCGLRIIKKVRELLAAQSIKSNAITSNP